MNVHKNAKLTPAGRAQMVERLEAGESVTEVADSIGVSRTTAYKWWKRWKAHGEKGLEDRSSRPHRSPNRPPRHRRRQIERLRRERWSTPRIARELKMPVSTVGRECRHMGLGRLRNLDPPTPAIRYERDRPGELLHLDTKKLARIERVGHRIHGDRSKRVYGAGWEYLHVCIDDATRLAYAEILPGERGETAAGFLRRAIRWFAAQGVATERVMTDNGSCYRSKLFAAVLKEHGARHLRTRPYTPRTNGKAERFIRTAKEGWAYACPYGHASDRTAQLRTFLNYYNAGHPHGGIGGLTPLQRLVELRVTNVLEKHRGRYHGGTLRFHRTVQPVEVHRSGRGSREPAAHLVQYPATDESSSSRDRYSSGHPCSFWRFSSPSMGRRAPAENRATSCRHVSDPPACGTAFVVPLQGVPQPEGCA